MSAESRSGGYPLRGASWYTERMKRSVYLVSIFSLLLISGCGPDPAKYSTYVSEGQAALRLGNWKEACAHLGDAARLNPKDGHLQYNLGMALLRANKLRPAAKAFYQAASLLQEDESIDAMLGLARVQADLRRWEDADDALETARQCAPEHRMADVLAALSGLRYRQRNWEAARALAAEALDLRLQHPVALYTLGSIFLHHDGEHAAARRAFDRYYMALGSAPDAEASSLPDPRNDVLKGVVPGPRSTTAENLQRSTEIAVPTEACEVARAIAYSDPLDGEAWRNYGNLCLRANRPEEALRAYHRFARLSPNSASLALVPEGYRLGATAGYLEKANLALNTGNLTAAEKQYTLALEADPECVDALIGMEGICYRKNDPAGALAYARRANVYRPNQADLLFRIACYLAPQPQYRLEAVRYYRRYLQFGDPASAQAEAVRTWLRAAEAEPIPQS